MNTLATIILISFLTLIVVGVGVVKAASYSEIKYPTTHPDPLDVPRIIYAIKQVENWDGHTRGAAGEWGPMQMTPSIYLIFHEDEPGYIRHLESEAWVCGRRPTPWVIGLLHNAGYPAVHSGKLPAMKKDFASRVQNVYEASGP